MNFSVQETTFNSMPALDFFAADRGCLPALNEIAGQAGCFQKRLTLQTFDVVADTNCGNFLNLLVNNPNFEQRCVQAAIDLYNRIHRLSSEEGNRQETSRLSPGAKH